MPSLIKQIQRLRINQGLSKFELARRAGYYRTDLGRWEVGKHTPKESVVVDLAQAMGYEFVLRPINKS